MPTAPIALVCGAGIGGAATALLLAATGWQVTVLERAADPATLADGGTALVLAPNGLAVLDALGLGAAVRRRSVLLPGGLPLRDERGRVLRPVQVAPRPDGRDEFAVLLRSDLIGLLHRALARDDRVRLRLGCRVRHAEPVGRVTTADGSRLDGLLVVGADGTRSAVREAVDIPARVAPAVVRFVRLLSRVAPPDGLAGEHWTRLGLFGLAPTPAGSYVYACPTQATVSDSVRRADLAAFREAWTELIPAAAPVLDDVRRWEDVLVSDVSEVRCERLVRGRAALVGDAAHAMTPHLGQGANSALVDAAVLAAELARTDSVTAGLRAYDGRRRLAVRRVQAASRRLMRLAAARSGPGRLARDVLLRWSGGQAGALLQEDPGWLAGVGRPDDGRTTGRPPD